MKRNLAWIILVICSLSMGVAASDKYFGFASDKYFGFAYVANQASNTVTVIDRATNSVVATIGVGPTPGGVAVTHDGKEVWVVAENEIDIIDTATNKVSATLSFSYDLQPLVQPNSVVFSPDGKRAYVVINEINNLSIGGNGIVLVIDRASHVIVKTIVVGEFPWSVAITPNGKHLYVTNSIDGTVSVIDTTTLSVVYTTPVIAGQTFGLATTPDGKYVYVMGGNVGGSAALVMDTATNAITTTIPMPSAAWVAITPNGKFAYVTDVDFDTVRVIDTKTKSIAATITGPACSTLCGATGVAIGPFGRYAYATSHGDSVYVINTSSNTVVDTIVVGNGPAGIAVRPLP